MKVVREMNHLIIGGTAFATKLVRDPYCGGTNAEQGGTNAGTITVLRSLLCVSLVQQVLDESLSLLRLVTDQEQQQEQQPPHRTPSEPAGDFSSPRPHGNSVKDQDGSRRRAAFDPKAGVSRLSSRGGAATKRPVPNSALWRIHVINTGYDRV